MTGSGDSSTSTPNPNLNVTNKRFLTRTRNYSHQLQPPPHGILGQCLGIRYSFKRRCSELNTDGRWEKQFQPQRLRLNLNSHLETTHVVLKGCLPEQDRIKILRTPTPTRTSILKRRHVTKRLTPSEKGNSLSTVSL